MLWQSIFKVSNAAVTVLLQFFSIFICQLAFITDLERLKSLSDIFPNTLLKAQTIAKLNRNDFKQFVCCQKCCALYDIDECFDHIGSQRIPKVCSSARFPRHPWVSMRGTCGSNLVKLVKTSQKEIHKPIKIFCFKSVTSSITGILSRPGMVDVCEQGRERYNVDDVYTDVYDGAVWQNLKSSGFFDQPHSYGLLLNVDWFEPFEHSIYATGVVFMSLLNLPRHIRYCQENIIICGLIPGPREPSHNINSFLEPLVEDLLTLWRGKEIKLPSKTISIQAALICVSCDSPAMRKVCGFVAHNAVKGCYKCMKSFQTASFGEKPDYGGFDRSTWVLRKHKDCFDAGMLHKHAKTAKERSAIERSYGVRYTALLTLPYYDAVSFCMIDPMHNLLLGSAKTFTKMWIEQAQACDFTHIQRIVNDFITPSGIGRLPGKVENKFSDFKAEQWKNWILIYSIVCFKPFLSNCQYSMWLLFVKACSLLCSHAISKNAISLADGLIHRYCCLFEAEFGKDSCYPNLHMHCHLKQCLLDFGPATSFWLFSFERMNGVLGKFRTSNRAVEVQLFRKFISKQQIHLFEWPDINLTHKLQPLMNSLEATKDNTHCGGTFIHILSPFKKTAINEANNCCKLLPPIKEKAFLPLDLQLIDACFCSCFGEEYIRTLILHKASKSIIFNGDIYGTFSSRQKNNSLIIVRERKENGTIHECVCMIVGFVKCTALMKNGSTGSVQKDFTLVKIIKLQEHDQRHYYSQPVQVFLKPELHLNNSFIFFHLSCVLCRCAYTTFVNDCSAIVVVPSNPYSGLL